MSKHKKRVSLAQQAQSQPSAPALTRLAAEPVEAVEETAEVVKAKTVAVEPPDSAQSSSTASAPGIETLPVFWFVLGALTVGIIVLIGLLIMSPGPGKAAVPSANNPVARAATATPINNPAARPATATPPAIAAGQSQSDQSSVWATITAAVEANASVPRISIQEAKSKLESGSALVIDVRSKDAFAEKHIKGALNIPEAETISRLSEFPKDKEIILYCA